MDKNVCEHEANETCPHVSETKLLSSCHRSLVSELMEEDSDFFYTYMRMSETTFQALLDIVKTRLTKKDTNYRKAISPAERLALTLRFLGHGDSQALLSLTYRIGKSTVCKIVNETTRILWEELKLEFMPIPTEADFNDTEQNFRSKWQVPCAVGAIDGKHVRLVCPKKSGSLYYNYKNYFSMVLMAVCDADYIFTMIDIGNYGSQCDSNVFQNSRFGRQLRSGHLVFPAPKPLFEGGPSLPCFLLGDGGFALQPNLMRPFPGQNLGHRETIYNYRHSRGRRVIENAFGILSNKWSIFHRPMNLTPAHASNVVKACCVLHNFVRKKEGKFTIHDDVFGSVADEQEVSVDVGEVGEAFASLHAARGNTTNVAKQMRNVLSQFFINQGSVPWQNQRVGILE